MNSVLHIMNYGASYRGNFIESLENLNRRLKDNNMRNIYLFCSSSKSNDARIWIDEMVKNGAVSEFLSDNRDADTKLIKKMIRDYNVSIVHTHFITMDQYLSVNKAVPANIPIVMHMHNHSKQSRFPKSVVRQHLYRRCVMLACSESVIKSLERDYPRIEKCYIDNGVFFDRLDNWSAINDEEYGVSESSTTFLVFGFDFYRKGVDLALRAINSLREKGYNYNLLISLSTNFEYVEEQVKLILGEVPSWVKIIKARNDVASLYNYVDVFLSPSREEGLPYSVVEAGYCNCSIVLSDISAQINLRLKYAYWFENENVEMFEAKILEAVNSHQAKINDIETVKSYMKANYDLETWSEKVVKLYQKLLFKD